MANTVKLKRGSGSDPSASDLVLGELAVRTDSGKIFLKKDDGSVAEVSGGGGVDDGDKGDITVSSSGSTWTIDADAVTYAKIQNVSATDRLLGRDSSGAGVIEEISPSSVRTMLGLATSATTDTTNADNISSGTLAAARVATLNQNTTGSAATITTSRNFSLTGEVTASDTSFNGSADCDIATTIANNVVDEANLKVSNSPTNGYFLSAQSGNTGGLTWAAVPAGVGGDTGVDFNDGVKARFGTGNDLSIYHYPDHNYIDSSNGRIYLRHGTDAAVVTWPDAQVELYYDNAKKFATTSQGCDIGFSDGNVRFMAANGSANIYIDVGDSEIKMWDNSKIVMGAGSDFSLYHDGSDSNITNSTGDLNILCTGDDVFIKAADDVYIRTQGDEKAIHCIGNGAVEIHYDDSKKAESYSSGLLLDGSVLKFENVSSTPSASNNTHIYAHDGLLKLCGGSGFQFEEGGFTRWKLTSGALHPHGTTYNNLGNSTNRVGNAYIQTSVDLVDNAEIRIGDSDDLKLYHDGSNSYIANTTGELYISASQVNIKSAAGEYMAYFNDNGEAALYFDDAKKLETSSAGCTVTGTCTATAFAGDGSSLTGISSSASGGGSDAIFWENGTNVTTNYTITNGKNAMSAGPITIDSGVTVTIGSGEAWTIV